MQRIIPTLTAAAMIGFMAYSTQAALVSVDGIKVFEDTFELGTVGSAPATNSPSIGTWSSTGTGATIVDEALVGVAAYEGDQFLRLAGPSSPRPGITSENVSVGSVGDLQVISFAFYMENVDAQADAALMVRITQVGGATLLRPWFYSDGSIRVRPPGGGSGSQVAIGGLTHNLGEWNTVVMSYVIGESTYDLTVNGVTATVDAYLQSGENLNGGFRSLNFRGDLSGDLLVYIDAIPEPASLALIGLGGLLMLRRKHTA